MLPRPTGSYTSIIYSSKNFMFVAKIGVNSVSHSSKQTQQYDAVVPILIVGGSVVGSSLSLFLAEQGAASLLIERHPGVSPFARAAAFNQRTLEIFRTCGLEATIRAHETPPDQLGRFTRVESLAGKELDALEQTQQPQQPQHNPFVDAGADSPVRAAMLGQNVLEPILQARARALGSEIRFSTELLSFEQDADGVSTLLRERTTGQEIRVYAQYLIAADGNKSAIRQRLGIGTHGYGSLAQYVNIRFRADLREALRGRDIMLCFVNNPQVQGFLTGKGDEWGLAATLSAELGDEPEQLSRERCIEMVRTAVGMPDLSIEVLHTTYWEAAARVADSYQQGRVLLVGDAVHAMPPTGAFGANTGIADAHNLAWKLAYVHKGYAQPGLLSTYQSERQPVADLTTGAAVGLYAYRLTQPEEREAISRSAEALFARAPKEQYVAGDNFALGYRYRSGALLVETAAEDQDILFGKQPAGYPGFRAPHIVLEREGRQLSTIDLYGHSIVLLTGMEGNAWCSAARQIAQRLHLPLEVYRIGARGDYCDSAGDFLAAYRIADSGAVLVRPDGFVAWHARLADEHVEETLERVLTLLLFR